MATGLSTRLIVYLLYFSRLYGTPKVKTHWTIAPVSWVHYLFSGPRFQRRPRSPLNVSRKFLSALRQVLGFPPTCFSVCIKLGLSPKRQSRLAFRPVLLPHVIRPHGRITYRTETKRVYTCGITSLPQLTLVIKRSPRWRTSRQGRTGWASKL